MRPKYRWNEGIPFPMQSSYECLYPVFEVSLSEYSNVDYEIDFEVGQFVRSYDSGYKSRFVSQEGNLQEFQVTNRVHPALRDGKIVVTIEQLEDGRTKFIGYLWELPDPEDIRYDVPF